MNTIYRQGDVLLIKVEKLPKEATKIERENGLLILAKGESTGHHHSIASRQAKLLRDTQGAMYLTLLVYAYLKHQEHEKIKLPPGDYLVKRQIEYSPEAIRNVAD
jgi:hypothetical protein